MHRSYCSALLLIAACEPVDFNSDGTTVTATGTGDSVDVSICAGPSGLLACNQNNQSFRVSVGSETEDATEGFLSFGSLEAGFSTNVAEAPVVVAREDGLLATATMPVPLALSSPESATTIARGTHVHLVWTASSDGDTLTWTAGLSCHGHDYPGTPATVDDTGVLSISSGDFPDGESGTCDASVTLTRTRHGSMGGFPSGSTFVAEQTDVIGFQLQQ